MIKSNISDVAVDLVVMDVRVKFGDSVLNRIIQLFAGRSRFMHFYAVFK